MSDDQIARVLDIARKALEVAQKAQGAPSAEIERMWAAINATDLGWDFTETELRTKGIDIVSWKRGFDDAVLAIRTRASLHGPFGKVEE